MGQSQRLGEMRIILLAFVATIICSCSPVQDDNKDLPTKYPDAPTMQSAEDANTKTFNEHSFDK